MSNLAGDTELLQASLAGSKEAFEAIVQRYQSLVCAIAYSATGDIGRSEELAQESFLRAWKNLRQLQDLNSFRTWLCTIVRNLASQSVREKPRDVLHAAEPLEAVEAVAAATPEPGQAAMDSELQEIVWAAVGRVPQKYREPLVLFYRCQQSVSEVAADLGLSEVVVRQRLHRGRQFIRAEVASLVEDALTRSGPGKAFAIAVVAALPAIVTPTASAAVAGAVVKGTPAARTVFAGGLSGAVLGPILGLLGGILGTWCGIRNTSSPRERRFMIRMALLVWLLLFTLIGLPLTLALARLIPMWAHWSCFAVFFVVLLPLILWGNARQRRIQIEEGTYRPSQCGLAHVPRPGMHISFAGPIFGGTLWLLILTVLAGDWRSFAVILGFDVLLLLGAVALYRRDPQRYWSIALVTACSLLAMTFAAVNLRWAAWMDAYRRSSAYDPRNDVGLPTLNLVLLAATVGLLVPLAIQYVRHRRRREERVPDGRQ